MRTTTPATTTTNDVPPTTSGHAQRRGPLRTGAALSLGVGAAAAAVLLPTSTVQPVEVAAPATSSVAAAIQPDALTVSDREAAAERSMSRSSRSGERAATGARDEVPAALAEPELERAGHRYTTTNLNVRVAPDRDADIEAVLKPGTRVTITDVSKSGFRQVIHEGEPRWVDADYLTSSKPKPKPKPRPQAPEASSAGPSRTPCASGSAVERGLQASAIAVHRAVCHAFPSVTSYGGIRANSTNHAAGRALDIMVTGSTGDAIAQYVRANAGSLGVTEVIWEQRIWTTQRAGEGWRMMEDRGSATDNHFDHVHVSTR